MTRRVRVGDVLKLERRAVQVDPAGEYEEIGLRSFGKGIFHKAPVSGIELGTKRVFRIQPGDLVISNVFAWEGAIAVASEADVGKIGSHRFMTFTATDDRLIPTWAAWFLLSEPGLELLGRASPGSAGRNRTLAVERFEALEIPLPSIAEQRRVAAQLTHYAGAAAALENLVQRSAGLGSALRSALTMRTPEQPLDWRRHRLDSLLELNSSESQVDATASYPIAGVYSFGKGLFTRGTLQGGDTSYRTLNRLRSGDLVMSRLKAWEGALAIVPPEFDGYYLSPEFPTFAINRQQALPSFLGTILTSESFWSRLRGASKGMGARKERVHAERLLDQEVELPTLSEQERLARTIEMASAVTRTFPDRLARISALVPAALDAAFSGVN